MKNDIIIIGAGLTGMTMACSLAKEGLNVTVIEHNDINKLKTQKSDGRTCAISYGSSRIFAKLDLWQKLEKNAGPILDIRVTDNNCPLFVHYDHKMVGDEPMGYIIENFHLREALFAQASKYKNLEIIDNIKYDSISYEDEVIATLENGRKVTALLLIAADGINSYIRKNLGIKSTKWSYKQSGIVCTVKHQNQHNGVAIEKFLPSGPFAILPMLDKQHSSIVWTEPTDVAKLYLQMDESEFTEYLAEKFSGYLGKLNLVGQRFSYPLNLNLARKYTAKRMALIGDAAHGMHPIAGQGFNLGIRDVPVLTNAILKAKDQGLDIGSDIVLNEYNKLRKFDNVSLLIVTDFLNRLFSNDIIVIKQLRRIGLGTVNKIPALKRFLTKHAMGVTFNN